MLKLFFSVFLITFAVVANAARQEITFYSDFDLQGDSVTFKSQKPNLTGYEAVTKSKSLCVTGFWVGYRNNGYNSHLNYYGDYSNFDLKICRNNTWMDVVTSLRHIGAEDTTIPAISLFSNMTLEGEEFHVKNSATGNLPFQPHSFATTGKSSWTFYFGPNFDGNSTCVRAGTQNLYFIENYPFKYQSLALGCGQEAIHNVQKYLHQ